MFTLIVLSCLLQVGLGIIGYDCGARSLNITSISLLDVGNCELSNVPVNVSSKYVQLLQVNEFVNTHVTQCKIIVHRTVYHCGAFSHISAVLHGEAEFVQEISKRKCLEVYNTGTFYLDGKHTISGIKVNTTAMRPILFAGYLNEGGTCNGASYSDAYGNWESVVVQGMVKITVQEQTGAVNIDRNQIILKSGMRCTLSDESCVDMEGGYTFWSPIPVDSCKFNQYTILYEGPVQKIVDSTRNHENVVYSLTTQEITFALMVKNKEKACGYEVLRTEHPKLVIFETTKGTSFASRKKDNVNNLDIFAYVNSKFVFVEHYLKTQVQYLYKDVLMHRCKQEQLTLQNSLAIAIQAPDQFAYNLMKGPGYMAVVGGEVVHIVKCVPVEVKIHHGDKCYAELLVSHNNQSKFLMPRTHILKNYGTEITCNSLLPSQFHFHDNWYKFTPAIGNAKEPIVLQPSKTETWKYQDIPSLATSGIYTEADLETLKDRIMFPIERSSMINEVTKEIHGHEISDNEGTIGKLLNENAIEKLITSTWNRMWNKFLTFGTVSAGIFSIIVIMQGIKMIITFFVNGYALHQAYGWSLYLLAAAWRSLANFLLYLAKPTPSSKIKKNNPGPENPHPGNDSTNEERRAILVNSPQNVVKPTYVTISETSSNPKVTLET